MLNLQIKRSGRAIDDLRARHPGKWTYLGGHGRYECDDGTCAQWVSALSPHYDGDDSFRSELWLYFKDGQRPERIR